MKNLNVGWSSSPFFMGEIGLLGYNGYSRLVIGMENRDDRFGSCIVASETADSFT